MLAVLHAAQLVTGSAAPCRGNDLNRLDFIQDGGLLTDRGLVTRVGRSREVERLCDAQTEIVDASGCVVLPGFVDAHTHLAFAGDRLEDFEARARGDTYEEIARRGGGIRTTVAATRAARDDDLFAQAKRHALWMLRNGTTTAEAKSGYGLTTEDELKILRVIRRIGKETPLEVVPTFLGAHAVPAEFKSDRAAYVAQITDEMIPGVAQDELAEYCDIFCERGYFDSRETRRIATAAKEHGLQLRMHADQLSEGGGAALAAELGARTADHLEQTNASGIAALAAAQVQPVLLPASVYTLGLTRYPDARAMIDAGLAIVIASDFNPGSSPTPSIPFILSLAITQMKMTPAEAINAATINAAASLGRADQIGSLAPGKFANFAIYQCGDYREIAYWVGAPLLRVLFVRGKAVMFQ